MLLISMLRTFGVLPFGTPGMFTLDFEMFMFLIHFESPVFVFMLGWL